MKTAVQCQHNALTRFKLFRDSFAVTHGIVGAFLCAELPIWCCKTSI
ncbi:hypothetical protein PMI17_01619 [Pantoea sp. GM01]|nr:hypothetical protein PMI17_01619 [Pantoea sp. GM01]